VIVKEFGKNIPGGSSRAYLAVVGLSRSATVCCSLSPPEVEGADLGLPVLCDLLNFWSRMPLAIRFLSIPDCFLLGHRRDVDDSGSNFVDEPP
jgi:hypothetical protein